MPNLEYVRQCCVMFILVNEELCGCQVCWGQDYIQKYVENNVVSLRAQETVAVSACRNGCF